jgi:hypothetical protein
MKLLNFFLLVTGLLFSVAANAQCRSFVKNNCAELMGGYVVSENFNAARLNSGDLAELEMTFSKGEEYRLLVCSHPVLGEVSFRVLDAEQNVLYDNKESQMSPTFDFQVAGTQQLTVAIEVSANNATAIKPQGCVAVMVGTKISD